MNLNEALEILREHDFICEGAYKDILHQKFAEKRAKRETDNKNYEARQRKMGRLAKKISKEIEEFISDLADEMVSDKVTCKYDATEWTTNIQVENRKYKVYVTGYGQIEFRKETADGRWQVIETITNLEYLPTFLENVFDYITEAAA